MSDVNVLVLRHAQTIWNAEGRWQGLHDPPLSDLGRRQAVEVCEYLAPHGFRKVVSSTLSRARETARIIAEGLDLPAPEAHPGLVERDAGDFGGLTWSEIYERFPEIREARERGEHIAPPGANNEGFEKRAMQTVVELATAPGPVLMVSHGGLIRSLQRSLQADAQRADNIGGHWFTVVDGKLVNGEHFPAPVVDLSGSVGIEFVSDGDVV